MSSGQQYSSFFTEFLSGPHDYLAEIISQNGGESVKDLGADAILGSWLVCFTLIALAFLARLGLNSTMSKQGLSKYHAESGFSIRNIFEIYTGFIRKLSDDNMGRKDSQKFFWFFGGLFIYILFCNLIGVLPGGVPPTQSMSNNLAMSLVVLFIFFGVGIARQGIAYFTHMAGPVIWLSILIFPIELFGALVVRPASLSIRLTGNINGDHQVLGVAYNLSEAIMGLGLPVAALALGVFVAFLQAFVFTLLSIVYVVLSSSHDDEH